MLFRWLLWAFVPFFDDLVLNPETGKASQKNLFQVFYGICGVSGAGVAVWADIKEHRPVNTAVIMFLLLASLGLAGLKIWQQQANRKTQDEDGALTEPKPEPKQEPKLMPQGPPVAETETLAGYNDGPDATLPPAPKVY